MLTCLHPSRQLSFLGDLAAHGVDYRVLPRALGVLQAFCVWLALPVQGSPQVAGAISMWLAHSDDRSVVLRVAGPRLVDARRFTPRQLGWVLPHVQRAFVVERGLWPVAMPDRTPSFSLEFARFAEHAVAACPRGCVRN